MKTVHRTEKVRHVHKACRVISLIVESGVMSAYFRGTQIPLFERENTTMDGVAVYRLMTHRRNLIIYFDDFTHPQSLYHRGTWSISEDKSSLKSLLRFDMLRLSIFKAYFTTTDPSDTDVKNIYWQRMGARREVAKEVLLGCVGM